MNFKKFGKKLFILVLLLTSIFRISMPISAATGNVSLDTHGDRWRMGLSTVFYDRYLQTQRNITSIRIDNFSINGQNAYCVEPNVEIYPSIAMEILDGQAALNALHTAGYSDSQINEMALISSLGYGYANDFSEEMNAATQVRIWQVHFGDVISNIPADIQARIDVINERIRKMNTSLSFENQTVELNGYGEKYAVTLEDTNGILSDYVLNSSIAGVHVDKNGNTLRLWVEKGSAESGTITFDGLYSRNEANNNCIAYFNPQNQTLASFGKTTPRQASFNYRVKETEGRIQVNKIGEALKSATVTTEEKKTKTAFEYEEIGLENTQFEVIAAEDIKDPAGDIVYKQDEKVDTITTDQTGVALTKDLPFGKYILKEVQATVGYVQNKDPIEVELQISKDGQTVVQKDIKNERVKIALDLEKVSASTKKPLQNALYGLYLKEDLNGVDGIVLPKDTLVETSYSNEDGKIVFDGDFPLALYELKEIEPCPGYALNTEIIEIDARNPKNTDTIHIEKVLENDFNTISICVNKVDQNNNVIKNNRFEFGLYKDKECKELIESKINEDNAGYVQFDDLDVGTYYIKEITAPNGYKLSDEVVCVQVKEYGQVLINEKEVKTDEERVYSLSYKNERIPEIQTGLQNNTTLFVALIAISGATILIYLVRKYKA